MVFFHTPIKQTKKSHFRLILALSISLFLGVSILSPLQSVKAAPDADIWLSIDTETLSIVVMKGDKELKSFDNIAIGSNGSTSSRRVGDQTTPLGDFRITEIRPSTRFELFMAFDYPNLDHTERAFQEKRIDEVEYRALRYDLDRGNPPPQGTSLGGYLGIHGLGKGDIKIHESVNWTEGCIAVTNEQLMELADIVAVGTRVSVR